jgi:hypothetical protein
MHFDPRDPFPLWPGYGPELYASAKKHAAACDAWLGLGVEGIEEKLRDPRDGEERWIGRHPSIFLTPYVELRAILEEVRPREGETVADLGAGYGRLGFVLARHFPRSLFRGYEIVPERVNSGREALGRFGAPNARLEQGDLRSLPVPEASIYFIYDFGSRPSIARVLEELKGRSFTLVARGRGVRHEIDRHHPWLSVHDPVHGPHYSVYRSV